MSSQGFQQVQKQSQSLVLAPQLRNSLKILQAPAVELRTSILEELQANPLLEELAIDSISVEEHREEPNANELDQDEEMDFNADDFSAIERMSEDMREHYALENTGQSHTSEDEERREHFMNSLTTSTSLQQHLIEQAELTDCSDQEREALIYLIGSIDDNGFLTETVSNIALTSRIPYSSVSKACETLRTFEPQGIGTKDTQDCLATQLELRGRGTSTAARILRDHFELLIRRRIPELSRKLGVTTDDIQDAIVEISTLDPTPGKRFSPDSNTVIEPDVTVFKDEYGEWKIVLNNDYIPRLRISSTYKDMLAKGNLSKKEKEFMVERMRSGKFLINSIEQRQQTIERITREILKFQSDFFDAGVSKLRPLTMNTIAQTVSVHETTVSRAIANKYIRTPHGVFAFKYFFTPGYKAGGGEAVSNKSIKDMISHIIDEENPAKPYSDQGIVNILTEKDIKIARRTVAKYREELGILPTNLRRRYE
ncbi:MULTISPECIES: RNA polymerase factor sigma-54 [unclassified Lentimonas]|uniref:RNA polymerase factor sigma-54 n=1 Tax=unclassified Lentimonas TaxID=2630993 RepID=UPI00132396AE|nr:MULTISPECIES: RNA polymerase factor sigma-54 [unclassified Lentimonas]CAA6678358.1 RNA polymerase sigma-54 factor RpoN [Lentimonas sp. CC4]CAA6685450.1 RNA polymerase sigma-54 factor RpoN [Lentimonas sp. CC6]CAA6690565.1 RNA polymerase sigma-54 factor RpoN [Lentimonas sp. CC10]CAA6695342.1 RNA polymerase sigma-54 factor RpoN [Lentimonas sp. CC19]CAA7068822.1 RNA polymerase sigma-54 factor RpoN [Lentimonas sp. CC11]